MMEQIDIDTMIAYFDQNPDLFRKALLHVEEQHFPALVEKIPLTTKLNFLASQGINSNFGMPDQYAAPSEQAAQLKSINENANQAMKLFRDNSLRTFSQMSAFNQA